VFLACAAPRPETSVSPFAVEIPTSGTWFTIDYAEAVDPLWEDCFAEKRGVLVENVQPVFRDGERVIPGRTIGHRIAEPAIRSPRFESELRRSEALYARRAYREAAAELEHAAAASPFDPFVVDALARALYWIDEERPKAFEHYLRLAQVLDAFGASRRPEHVYLNAWFSEAYWKLGTLYLDRAEYASAICWIARSRFADGRMTKGRGGEESAGFLAEAYFALGRADRADAYAREALRLNPANTYVLPYMSRRP
jgi:tetratricopeptide (TPR) repeat protein